MGANNDKPKNDDDVDNNAHWFLLFSGIKRDFLFDPNRDVYSTKGTGHWGTTILEHCPLGPILLIVINQKMMMMLITQCSLVPAFSGIKRDFLFDPNRDVYSTKGTGHWVQKKIGLGKKIGPKYVKKS